MSEESQKTAARCEFEIRCPPSIEPRLTPEEVASILERSRRGKLWATGLTLSVGDVIVIGNGRRYEVSVGGITGATEPTWTTITDGRVIDNTVTFKEAGSSFKLYDVGAAVREGWLAKLGKAAEYNNSEDGNESVIFDHCQKMLEMYDVPMVG